MSKEYLITGASSDIGLALIRHIMEIENDCTIVGHYNSNRANIENIKVVNNNNLIPLKANLSLQSDIDELIDNVKAIGIPDVIIHLCAPKLEYINIKDLTWDECMKDAQVQVGSIFKIIQSILPKMIKAHERSKIIFMLSENVVNNPAKFTAKYSMSKYMLLGLMKSLLSDYSGKKVNINALSPSMIDTKLLSNIDRRLLEMSGATDNMLHPEDIIPYFDMLLSESGNTINGENIYIPGRNGSNE